MRLIYAAHSSRILWCDPTETKLTMCMWGWGREIVVLKDSGFGQTVQVYGGHFAGSLSALGIFRVPLRVWGFSRCQGLGDSPGKNFQERLKVDSFRLVDQSVGIFSFPSLVLHNKVTCSMYTNIHILLKT